jgi:hypothetical protein
MAPASGNREIIQVGPDENDSGSGLRGLNTNFHRNAAVQTYSRGFHRILDRGFKSHEVSPASSIYYNTTRMK